MNLLVFENSDFGQDGSTGGSRLPDEDAESLRQTIHGEILHERVHGPTVDFIEDSILSGQLDALITEEMAVAAHCASVRLADGYTLATGRNLSENDVNRWREMILVGMAMTEARANGELTFDGDTNDF